MEFELRTLVDKLNPVCRRALEGAAGLCVSQTHFTIELEHLLLKLFEETGTDIEPILRQFDINRDNIVRDLTRTVERHKRGNNATPSMSPHIRELIQNAWMVTSLHLHARLIRSGAMLLALLDDSSLRGMIVESVPLIGRIPREALRADLANLIAGTQEEMSSGVTDASTARDGGGGPASAGSGEALDAYTVDLTAQARNGKIDPIFGRDTEIRQIIDILMRRRQNNPILTGEAGVGKTAVVEGFAMRIVQGDVPEALQGVTLRTLDLGLLQAGAGVKGEFENRLKDVINEVKSSPTPIILFIDEAHTLVGAGGAAGQGDAANLLKPALARGELRTVAATTWAEYKKYFEKDPALTRRFQVVKVEEPDEANATDMLRGIVENLRRHHKVAILDEAVRDAVRLSQRYLPGRQLPDKAVSVLDTACARVAIGQKSTPVPVEAATAKIARLELELSALQREEIATNAHDHRIAEIREQIEATREELNALEDTWQRELALVSEIGELRNRIDTAAADNAADRDALANDVQRLMNLREELEAHQGDNPMVHPEVGSEIVASVISGWTGIPIGKMLSDEIRGILSLERRMAERVVGQDEGLREICRRIHTSKADLVDPQKPVGVFLLVGPSGVGKTETAIALADLLYGGERNLVTINMSEFQEAHTVSTLKGSPPGYVGYGQGGVLTEAVRRNPYSVVLLDEVEKAHPDVMELFYQVFDKGRLEDGEGIEVDFKNTVIVLTSNIGTAEIIDLWRNHGNDLTVEAINETIRPALLDHFKPALLGRLTIVPYFPLGDEQIRDILGLKLGKIVKRFKENRRADLTVDAPLFMSIAARCTEVDSGARNIDHILTQTLLPELSAAVLERMADNTPFTSVHVTTGEDGGFEYHFRDANAIEDEAIIETLPIADVDEIAEIEAG